MESQGGGATARVCAPAATVLQLGCTGSRNMPHHNSSWPSRGQPEQVGWAQAALLPVGPKTLILPEDRTAGEKLSAALVAVTRALCVLTHSKVAALGLAVPWPRACGDAQWFPSLLWGSCQTDPFMTREPIPGSCSRS